MHASITEGKYSYQRLDRPSPVHRVFEFSVLKIRLERVEGERVYPKVS